MSSNYTLKGIATDLTLVYGAESYIRRRGSSSTDADPEGRACLAAVIDMVLSSDKFYLTLPGDIEGSESQLVRRLEKYVTKLPKAANILLKDDVEKHIAEGFINFALVRGLPWFRSWLAFQLNDPIVVPAHALRLDGEWISDQGRNAWETIRTSAKEKLKSWNNLLQIHSLHDAVRAHQRDLTDWDFPLCYAYDVYRRGWQYAEHVRTLNKSVAYLPHPFRQNSLESGTQAWAEVDMVQRYLWSWGDYFCHVLDDERLPAYKNVDGIMDLVDRVKELADGNDCPLWSDYGYIDIGDETSENKEKLIAIDNIFRDIAKKAKLPLLKRSELDGKFTNTLGDITLDSIGLSTIANTLKLVQVIVHKLFVNEVAKVETGFEQKKRDLSAHFYTANYDYRGLIRRPRQLP